MSESLTVLLAKHALRCGKPLTAREIADKFGVTYECALRAMWRVAQRGGVFTEVGGRKALKVDVPIIKPERHLPRPLVAVAADGSVTEFSSISDARRNGFTPTCIERAVNTGTRYAGFFWRYPEDDQWTPDEVRALLDGITPPGKAPSSVLRMKIVCGLVTPGSNDAVCDELRKVIMSNKMTIDEAAHHYGMTPQRVCKVMGWA